MQGYDRYAYVNNSPVRYNDPSGHCIPLDDGDMCLRNDENGSYHIVHPGRERFANDTEVAIADFIISNDTSPLNRIPASNPIFIGAAIENACSGLGIDCGDYYRTIFNIMAASFVSWAGAYPSAGTNPGSTANNPVPSPIRPDIMGDPDCPGCGYNWDISASSVPGGAPQLTVLGFNEDVKFYTNVNVNLLHDQLYYNWGMNEQFLKAGMYRGDTFYFASDYNLGPQRLFASEVYFLGDYPNIIDLFHP